MEKHPPYKNEKLNVEIKDDEIIIKPFNSPAGSLKKYAKKGKNIEKIIEEEKKVLEEAIIEMYINKKTK